MSLPLSLQPGILIGGQYIVGTLINSGGFGAVYRGIDTSEGDRPCAIKETYDVSPTARRRALVEASILFTVSSKHLPQVYDAFEANGRFYLVMQLIEGQDLQHLLKMRENSIGQPFTEQQVLTWLLPIMQVLQELHSRSPAVMHRDIKPANIILTPEPAAVLVDFGLTRLYEADNSGQTGARAVSEGFSPIEQYFGKTTPQSDIYALAATMYMLLTNKVPPSALNRSLHDDLVAPRLYNPAISPRIERALLKAQALQPEDRYASMRDFALALQGSIFTAHDDPTVAASPIPPPPPPPVPVVQASSPIGASSAASPTARSNTPVKTSQGRGQCSNGQNVPPTAPIRASSVPYSAPIPPGYVLVPQSALAPQKPLPGASGQGCLWGLLQGILSALLLLMLKKEADFYVAIAMGFLFYLVAGFFTARRGGSSFRGAWAGLWAGIISTTAFWIVLLVGLLIQMANRINIDQQAARLNGQNVPPDEIQHAWKAVMPAFLNSSSAQPSSSSQSGLIVFLVGGILLAFVFGWLGGFLGKMNYQARLQKRTRTILKNAI